MVKEELIKLLRPKKLLLLAGFSVIYFMLFLKPYVKINPGTYQYQVDIGRQIIADYGNELSAQEFEQLRASMPPIVPDAIDCTLAGNSRMAELGIESVKDFMDRSDILSDEEMKEVWAVLYDNFTELEVSEKIDGIMKQNYWNEVVVSYEIETGKKTQYYKNLSDEQMARVNGRSEKELTSVLPWAVLRNHLEVLQFISAWMLLSVIFIVVPYMVKDHMSRMFAVQYAAAPGRKFFRTRAKAVGLGCGIVLAAEAVLCGGIVWINGTFSFWNSSVSSFDSGFIGWFNWTLGQLTLAAIGLSIGAALGLAAIVLAVTRFCGNYITAIAWQLPLAVFSGIFGGVLMISFTEITKAKWQTIAAGAAAAIVGIVVLTGVYMRERRADI